MDKHNTVQYNLCIEYMIYMKHMTVVVVVVVVIATVIVTDSGGCYCFRCWRCVCVCAI